MTPEDSGKHFEDFRKGQKLEGKVGRTVIDADNIWFTLLTNNSNQIHFNVDYAKKYFSGKPFEGRMVVNGFLTLGIVAGLARGRSRSHYLASGVERVTGTDRPEELHFVDSEHEAVHAGGVDQ